MKEQKMRNKKHRHRHIRSNNTTIGRGFREVLIELIAFIYV